MSATPVFTLSLPARAESVTVVRHVLGGVIGIWPVDGELLDDIQIAVTEACANVVIHAYRDRPPGTLDVAGDVVDGHVVVTVVDNGPGMIPRPDATGLGMGLPLMGALTDHLQIGHVEDGTHEVRMTFPRTAK